MAGREREGRSGKGIPFPNSLPFEGKGAKIISLAELKARHNSKLPGRLPHLVYVLHQPAHTTLFPQ